MGKERVCYEVHVETWKNILAESVLNQQWRIILRSEQWTKKSAIVSLLLTAKHYLPTTKTCAFQTNILPFKYSKNIKLLTQNSYSSGVSSIFKDLWRHWKQLKTDLHIKNIFMFMKIQFYDEQRRSLLHRKELNN